MRSLLITGRYEDLEFFISWWNKEFHTIIAAYNEFIPTLEDVVMMTHLPTYVWQHKIHENTEEQR